MDKNFKHAFGPISHLMHMAPTMVEFFQIRRLILPQLKSKGVVWHRGTLLFRGGNEFFLQIHYDQVIEDELLDRLLL
eukprot:snap_masked-scaffold_12-processed-gene-5.36-mRNA-1 protein AED:1.00 eAED:1.00 QI:0/0/0/0/1/1/2/0/76